MRREVEAFARTNNLYRVVDLFTCILDHLGDQVNILDHILTSGPPLFSNITFMSPLGSSDQCVKSISTIFALSKYPTLDAPFGTTTHPATFVTSRFFPGSICCYVSGPSMRYNFTGVIARGMQLGIPHLFKPGKPRLLERSFEKLRVTGSAVYPAKHLGIVLSNLLSPHYFLLIEDESLSGR